MQWTFPHVWQSKGLKWENLAWLRRHYDSFCPPPAPRPRRSPVRKPCLIKKALRPFTAGRLFGQLNGVWENLAWLRRHYDRKIMSIPYNFYLQWENLAWLRRHYDGVSKEDMFIGVTLVRKPCLIKKALRHLPPRGRPLGDPHEVRKPCLIKKALRPLTFLRSITCTITREKTLPD